MANDKLTLRDFIYNDGLWSADELVPLDGIYFVDSYRGRDLEIQPVYRISATAEKLVKIRESLDCGVEDGLNVIIGYFKGYPIPINGSINLGRNNRLDHLKATPGQIEAVKSFADTDYWKSQMEEWHKAIDGE